MCVYFLAVVYVMLFVWQYFTFFLGINFSFLSECSFSPTHSFSFIREPFLVEFMRDGIEGSFRLDCERQYTKQQTPILPMIENVDWKYTHAKKEIWHKIQHFRGRSENDCVVHFYPKLTNWKSDIFSLFVDNVSFASGKPIPFISL